MNFATSDTFKLERQIQRICVVLFVIDKKICERKQIQQQQLNDEIQYEETRTNRLKKNHPNDLVKT